MKLYRIKKSNIDNRGLYANKDIKKGTRIIEYKGKIITRKQSEENPKFDNDKAILLTNSRYDLDGDFKYNTARLINHSCDPNCEVDGIGLKIWVYAIKNIKKVMNCRTIMDLALIKILKITRVNAGQKIALDILLNLNQDGV